MDNYKKLVKQFTLHGYMKKLAGSIRAKMSELRQHSNPNDERRWIWELIQNGKDVRQPDVAFEVQINFDKESQPGTLEFKHNGKPFTVKNITFLVEQVSSKDQEYEDDGQPTNTGKFGSGFLTTHLLSETVEVETVIKDDNLEYKKCVIELDRSPRDESGIVDSINKSLSILETLDEIPDFEDYDPNELNTVFRYILNEQAIDVATAGLEDLDRAIGYTLMFVPSITKVHLSHTDVSYRMLPATNLSKDVRLYTMIKDDFLGEENIEFLFVKGEKVQIAVPISKKKNKIYISSIPEKLPRLFCDFPILGTEDFPFPVIINSPFFNLNDPRSIVRLTDVEEPEINENKSLIQEAVTLYLKLLKQCEQSNIHHVFNMIGVNHDFSHDWISKDWHKKNVSTPLFEALSNAVIVDSANGGRRSMRNSDDKLQVHIPFHSAPVIREGIFDLLVDWAPGTLPKKEDIHYWYANIWPKWSKLSIKQLSGYIVSTENVKNLQDKLKEGVSAIDWLNNYYDLLNKEEFYIKDIVANEIKILPDQHGNFQLMKDLNFDPGIPEIFKDVLQDIGYDLRKELRHDDIYTKNDHKDNPKHEIVHGTTEVETVYALINDRIQDPDAENSLDAALKLARVFSEDENEVVPEYRQKLFDVINLCFDKDEKDKIIIDLPYNATVYEESDLIILSEICRKIAESLTLKGFADAFGFSDQKAAKKWLAEFIQLLMDMEQFGYLNNEEAPILLDQNGVFRFKEVLEDGDGTDETLKDVAEKLGYDFREHLIDPLLPVSFATETVSDADIAEKIMSLAGNLMTDAREDDDVKQAFIKLFAWLNRHPGKGAQLFGEFYVNRHRLCPPEEIASSLEKAALVDELLDEFNVTDINDLRELIGNQSTNESQVTPITRDILLSLGVKNPEEFRIALEDKNLGELFNHQSVPDAEYFMFVQALIDRTRERIKNFLIELEYDFTYADNTATTVFAGVQKDGREIDIVFRPSDNGVVIFYYGSEKDTLSSPGAELWIDNGSDDPLQLTLGKILKDNSISKIRIK